jgi:hypothetical protein
MAKAKYAARIDNIYFVSRIGLSLRWATQGIAREDLPTHIRQLLARLDRVEQREAADERAAGKAQTREDGPPA